MEQLPVVPWIAAMQGGVLLASLVTWLLIAGVYSRRGRILEYQPRRPVPWGPAAILPALAFVVMALMASLPGEISSPQELAEDATRSAQHLVAAILLPVMMAAFVVGIALLSRATAADLGLPTTAGGLLRDCGLGVATCVAAVGPVYAVQAVLLSITGQEEPSNHPLVKMISGEKPDLAVLVLGTVAAVIAAPICEEILYRLALQGWLEKVEDEQLGWRETAEVSSVSPVAEIPANAPTASTHVETETTRSDAAAALPPAILPPTADPPRRGIAGLPHGLAPILGSAALFGAAHFGYGPEPVPIFLLAIIFGYVYQRTHRILPCVVAHAAFNLLTMVSLWGMAFSE